MLPRWYFLTALCLLISLTSSADQPIDFNRDIRPILSNNCYRCHGPDENERQAGLRLDEQAGALAELDSGGRGIVPKDSAASAVYQRIISSDSDERMPPIESGKTLDDKEIALIKRWIDEGAPWRGHWSFIKPERPKVPEVIDKAKTRGAIDRFIQQRLAGEGLTPSDEADKLTLIRRATFDLTGLPPTLEEIDQFVADKSPNAYAALIDRLLKSPRYGEHMTRYWLDVARYGDTHGLHLDNRRQIWPYRDWLIQAFNKNMPFDQFTIEQLAGDLLPEATVDQKVASGFNRCNVTTSEGGSIAEEYRVRYSIDRVETTATVWLGLTAGCAVCHEHKFDPISQTEFYELYAYFYNFAEREMDGNALLPPGPTIDVVTPDIRRRTKELTDKRSLIDKQIAARRASVGDEVSAWEAKLRAGESKSSEPPSEMVVHVPFDENEKSASVVNTANAKSTGKVVGNSAWTKGKFSGAFSFNGKTHIELPGVADFERTDSFSYGAWVRPANQGHMVVLSRMDDGSSFRGYDLYLGGGQVFVHIIHQWDKNAIRLNTKAKLKVNQWQHVMMTYDGSSKAAGVKIFIDGKPTDVVVTHDSLGGTIKTAKPLRVGRRTPGAPMQGAVDDLRIYPRQLSDSEVASIAGSNPIAELVAIPLEKRTDKQKEQIQEFYLSSFDDEYNKLKKSRGEIEKQIAAVNKSIPKTLIMGDRPQKQPVYRLIRGQYEKPDKSVALQPGVPAALPSLPAEAPKNRLALAQWLVSPENPLTARVTVNRLWQQLFGTGIVKTSEDFGSQGEWPSHPQLLDWLATEFVENGWNVKHMMKLIMMSHAYRQSAHVAPEVLAKDKDNRLLARGPRFRLDAEMIRDAALMMSGLLIEKRGGPSVKPYQPDGLWKAVGYSGSNTVKFTQDHGDSLYRRSMYIFWKRTAPPPTMQIFDAPSREYCVMRRERTNTPSGALVLLNDIQFVEAARKFAERIMTEGGENLLQRVSFAFRTATARPATKDELAIVQRIYKRILAKYQADEASAVSLLGVGESPRNEKLNTAELATWTMIASMLLNLDETITKG